MRVKKIVCLLAILATCCSAVGCLRVDTSDSGNSSSISSEQSTGESASEEPVIVYHTVTFKQDGYDDVIREVADGEDLTDIPEPHGRPGYTVVWEGAELTNVRQDLTLRAVETVNVYTLTYKINYNYASMSNTTKKITYGTEFTLETPFVEPNAEYKFVKWIDEETKEEVKAGVYLYTKDVTLIGVWSDGHSNFY